MKVYDDNANKESKSFKNIISGRAAKRFFALKEKLHF